MTDPPLPTIPAGESRNFALSLPELPPIEGPGTGSDPSGSGGGISSECSDELSDLIGASDWGGLQDFIEAQTGQSIQDLTNPVWDQVASDGVTRSATVEVCGQPVELTISGDLVSVSGCTHLPTATLTLPQTNFDLPTQITGTNPPEPSGGAADYVTTDQVPDASVHLENPRLIWLKDTSDADQGLLDSHVLRVTSVSTGGEQYWSVLQIRASFTSKLNIQTEHNPAFPGYTTTSLYDSVFPLMHFMKLDRYLPGSGTPDTGDAIAIGTVGTSFGFNVITGTDYSAALSDVSSTFEEGETTFPHISFDELTTYQFEDSSLSEIQSDIDDYMAAKTPYDPDVTLDTDTAEVTYSYMTRQNAIYLPHLGCSTDQATAVIINWGGWVHRLGDTFWRGNLQDDDSPYINGMMVRLVRDDDPSCGVTNSVFKRLAPAESGTYDPSLTGAAADTPRDGRPPDTTPNPPIVPVGGGCRSSLDGPSSCNWTLPPGPDIPMPNDNFGGMPVFNTKFPNFPPIGCQIPDFGNMNPCGPGGGPGGHNTPLPGGRDRRGKRGEHPHVKTGGPTYGNPRRYTFSERTCPGQDMPGTTCFTVIVLLLMDCGISPLDIIFQVTAEWDKPFPENKCFRKGARIFDAAEWTARYLMLDIVDEGEPTNNVYIGPRYHRPGQTTWHFHEHYDLFVMDRGSSSEEIYGAVEVFGPNGSAISFVDSPFVTEDSPTLLVEVGANHSQADMDNLAAYKASLVRRTGTGIQVDVPYSVDYFLRDKFVVQAPDKGIEETYVIMGKESAINPEERDHILTGMLPATVRELDEFPVAVDTVDDEIPGTEFVFS